MALWQWGLLLLAVVWALQSYGVWLQMRHYSDVFKGITQKYADGFVGTGAFHGRFLKRGAIAIVVVSPDLAVRRILTVLAQDRVAAQRILMRNPISAWPCHQKVSGSHPELKGRRRRADRECSGRDHAGKSERSAEGSTRSHDVDGTSDSGLASCHNLCGKSREKENKS